LKLSSSSHAFREEGYKLKISFPRISEIIRKDSICLGAYLV